MPKRNQSAADQSVDQCGLLYALTGFRPGPKLLVVGPEAVAIETAENLAKLPSLVYLRGSIEIATGQTDGVPDDVLVLSAEDAEVDQSHWLVLARATRLGMISGRGIPRQLLRDQALAA